MLAMTARGSTALVSAAAGEALAGWLTAAYGDPAPAGKFVGSPVFWRGLFESSPSRPDSNGARHLSTPDHPPFGVFLRRAASATAGWRRRSSQNTSWRAARTVRHDDEPKNQPGRESSCLGARTQRCPDDARHPHPNEAGSRGGIDPRLRKWTRKSSHCVKAATPTRRSLAGWSWGAPLTPTEASCARSAVTTAPSAGNSSKTRKHASTDSSNGSATGMPQSRARSNAVCSA